MAGQPADPSGDAGAAHGDGPAAGHRGGGLRRPTGARRRDPERERGAARDITFEFSTPIENSNGFVVSDLPYFKYGLDFLPPHGEISCYWDDLNALIPFLESKGLNSGIHVVVRYKDLSGASYESRWRLHPFLYKDARLVRRKGMGDIVRAFENLKE